MKVYFYKEKKTGKVIIADSLLESEDFILLKENVEDASLEKHIPIYEKENDKLIVKVGETSHPMLENHYIMWIALVANDKVDVHYLRPEDEPITSFPYEEGATIYAYCNIHGLWKANIK